jgi:hypothetical protein
VRRLHVETFGEATPAVLVHGSFSWGGSTFREQLALAEEHRLIVDGALRR